MYEYGNGREDLEQELANLREEPESDERNSLIAQIQMQLADYAEPAPDSRWTDHYQPLDNMRR